jgi:hypothetical protein
MLLYKPAKGMRMYSRTAQGHRAWESAASGLPAHYRRIIGLIGAEASAEKIYAGMQAYAIRQVQDWLDELETLGFVELRIEEGGHRARPARHKAA